MSAGSRYHKSLVQARKIRRDDADADFAHSEAAALIPGRKKAAPFADAAFSGMTSCSMTTGRRL